MGGWRKTPVALLVISAIDAQGGRTLMSAWIETVSLFPQILPDNVALRKECVD